MQAHHHQGHHHHHNHTRRWGGSATLSLQEQASSYAANNTISTAHQYAPSIHGNSNNNNNNVQVAATTTTTTTTHTSMQQPLLPAPPLQPPSSSSLPRLLPSSTNNNSLITSSYHGSYSHHNNVNNNMQLGHNSPYSHSQFLSSTSPASAASRKNMHGRAQISEDEKEEIRMAFELFDANKTGKLSYRELKVAMRALDFDVNKAGVKKLMEEHTKDGNTDEVDMDEFMEILISKYKERDADEELSKAFRLFDEDGTGKITLKNLRKVARDLGEHIPEEELSAMIEEFDNDQDGGINEVEFYNIMKAEDFDD